MFKYIKKVSHKFFGSIQRQLIKGNSLNKCLRKVKIKNFINCFDFHPESRCIYYFANTGNVKNTININHYNYSKNNLFSNFKVMNSQKVIKIAILFTLS